LKTENLAIVLTDIAGFTQTTQSQSRQQNARLLANHNRILLPLVRRYQGRHVKSIGDALLLVFRSPTDAMLCAMAMQDALYEYNRHVPDAEQIHIRVAASAGEVRVTHNDVFGEAVNLTSRIESVTPVDEIYLSEAVYMAMNKAEVPAREVGTQELKGIQDKVRLYHLPRFSTPRLVPVDVMEADDMADLAYPYGGAHFAAMEEMSVRRPLLQAALVGGLAVAVLGGMGWYFLRPVSPAPSQAEPSSPPVATVVASQPAATTVASTASAKPVVPPRPNAGTGPNPAAGLAYARFSELRQARKDGMVNEQQFQSMSDALTRARNAEVETLRRAYRQDQLSLPEYRAQLEAIEERYR
jgi:class 3 adenylate cyclase